MSDESIPLPPLPELPPLPATPPPAEPAAAGAANARASSTQAPARASRENLFDPDADLKDAYFRWFKGWVSPMTMLRRLNYKMITLLVIVPILFLKMFLVPALASKAVEAFADSHDLEVTIDDWSADLFNLKATAHDAKVLAPGPRYARQEIFEAGEIEIDLSFWRKLRGKGWVQDVTVRGPKVYLERQLGGRWNWEELLGEMETEAVAAAQAPGHDPRDSVREASLATGSTETSDAGKPAFQIPKLVVEQMALQWVENVPGDSKGGIHQEVKATLYLDDMSVQASDLQGLTDMRPQPTRLSLDARTGNGRLSFDGRANFFHRSDADGEGGLRTAEASFRAPTWTPMLDVKIYLENVGSGAFARLTPDAPIVPERGSLSGSIELQLAEHSVSCVANLDFRDVTFAVNRSSPLVGSRADQMESQLASYRFTGQRQFACGGLLTSDDYRPFQAYLTNVTNQGLEKAPKTVRAVAAIDHRRYDSQATIDSNLEGEVNRVLRTIDPEVRKWMKIHQTVSAYTGSLPIPAPPGPLEKFRRRFLSRFLGQVPGPSAYTPSPR
ncbi:MAG: hypothetical protein KDD47_14915 [Acidobacteria bacterium]|nr:hypothetical protein [Acidobacteriota bacterium]